MSEKKNSIDEILCEMNFSSEERDVFAKSIEYSKQEQSGEEINAKDMIMQLVKELSGHEI